MLIINLTGAGYNTAFSQDPQFSQFYSAPLYLGPSFAGSSGYIRTGMNIRAQWVQLPLAYNTESFYIDNYFEKYKLGAGLSALHDNAGGLLSTMFLATQYSYRIDLGRNNHFVPGLQVQYFTKKINSSELVFSDQIYNGSIMPSSIDTWDDDRYYHFDFAVSGLVFGDNYWMGFTGNHLMKFNKHLPNDQDYASFLVAAYGGYKFDMSRRNRVTKIEKSITVAFNYKTQEKLHQLDIGFYHVNSPFMIGVWYRGIPFISNNHTYTKDALTLMAGYRTGMLSFAYSYDMTLSRLITSTGGSHEISVSYSFMNLVSKQRRIKAIPCPDF